MPTYIKIIIALIILGIGIAYWYARSSIEPVYFTPDENRQIEKTP